MKLLPLSVVFPTRARHLSCRCLLLVALVLPACGDDAPTPTQAEDASATGSDRDAAAPIDSGSKPALDANFKSDGSVALELDAEILDDAGSASDAALSLDAASLSDAGPVVVDTTAALYAPDKLLDVQITLSAADWDALRKEGRSINDVFSGCADEDFEYTKFHAKLTVDGQTFEDVGVRKKGYLGSISVRRPSLRVELDEYVDKQNVSGAKTLTLNNNLSDASYVHTCMAYDAFHAAGLPAPRCSFAKVTVNGTLIGIYTHVEPVKKPFLKRVFGNDQGNLYEGSGPADFRTDMLQNFDKKTNEADQSKPELEALAALLLKSDAELVAGIDALLDVEQYIRFWAVETLVAHWDGYNRDLNNFFVYAPTDSKKLSFIAWGPDDAYDNDPPLLQLPPGTPKSVYYASRLARRFYAIPALRDRYRQALRDQLAQHWDEAKLLAEIDRINTLIGGVANATELETQRTFIRNRRAELTTELDAAPPELTLPERALSTCMPETVVPLSGTFSTTFGSLAAAPSPLTSSSKLLLAATPYDFGFAGVGDRVEPRTTKDSTLSLTLVLADGTLLVTQYQVGQSPLLVGNVPMHGFETYGVLLNGPDSAGLKLLGFVGEGSLQFAAASATAGQPVSGTFSGKAVLFAAPPVAALPALPPAP